ncbi:MaoC/PaaZ C-terminal domain-containing protein [Actinoplanes sp. KI2]|uniref:MaoC/PaaZ C-terminal domain-containing protein n=1 Tax=Actinoplanes sp. KI2 TaxID=2983315 RepID=UPI0021D5CE0E|nr:MaoC/PaaZ C-terminal domain-containing protein [Actinoplanes sp. KI2]MCU7729208.1 MaoC/PaaZ C-terminal domain-containing protein [Actinoplanes sp. KI2]
MDVVELSADPAGIYLKAALGLLPTRRGSSLPAREIVRRAVAVDLARLARYNRVCGFRLGNPLPATYPHVLAFPLAMALMTASDFPFPAVGIVHVANRITVHRPVATAERLDLLVHAENLRSHDRGRVFDMVATAAVDGETVWTGVSTYLSKNAGKSAGRGKRDYPPAPAPTAIWGVPGRVGRDYAAVSGDHNPIHTSRIGARLFGFARPIAHGMWTKARAVAALEGRLPAAYTVDVAFKQPITLPSTVGFTAVERADGWDFRVDGKRPHLAGQVTPP